MPRATAQTEEQTANSKPVRDQTSPVSGPSFLGLGDESDSTATYLLEEDPGSSHWGRSVVLVGVLGCVTAAAWHWRHDLRDWAAKFSHPSSAPQTEQVSYSASPISTSGSAAAPNGQSITDNPTTESPTQPGGGLQPAGTAAEQGNTLAEAQPIQRPIAAQAENQTEQVSNSASPISTSGSAAAPNGQAIEDNPRTESPTQPGGGLQPAGTAAEQRNTLAEAQPIQQPIAAQPGDRTPLGGNQSTTRPTSKKGEPAARTGSFAEERPAKEPTGSPKGPEAPVVASGSADDALEAEGERYLYGTESPANCARAQRDLLAAAERSNAKGESVLGAMYATGHCVPRDLPLAYRWFAKALRQEPDNARFEGDVQILWNQMTPDERQTAMRPQ
jgi:hypothetical protein